MAKKLEKKYWALETCTKSQKIIVIIIIYLFLIFRAQGLKASITSGSRLRTQSEHFAYILIDRASNDGLGSVVGLLKGKYSTKYFIEMSQVYDSVCTLCCISLRRCCFGLENRVIIKISTQETLTDFYGDKARKKMGKKIPKWPTQKH